MKCKKYGKHRFDKEGYCRCGMHKTEILSAALDLSYDVAMIKRFHNKYIDMYIKSDFKKYNH